MFNNSEAYLRGSISSVTQSYPTLCDPMDCSRRSFPVCHQLPEFAQTHVWVSDAIQPSHPLSPSSPPALNLSQKQSPESFQMSQLSVSGGQSIGASASASVLPMNIQDWSPLGWTGWISLQSKGLSRVFSNTTVQKHQFSMLSFLYGPTLYALCLFQLFKKSYGVLFYSTIGQRRVTSIRINPWHFPGGPIVKTSNAGDTDLIPGWGIKIPHDPKIQSKKKELTLACSRSESL